MTRQPGFPVDELRGRLLHESLLASSQDFVRGMNWMTETSQAPSFPDHAETDTGTLRAVVVAI